VKTVGDDERVQVARSMKERAIAALLLSHAHDLEARLMEEKLRIADEMIAESWRRVIATRARMREGREGDHCPSIPPDLDPDDLPLDLSIIFPEDVSRTVLRELYEIVRIAAAPVPSDEEERRRDRTEKRPAPEARRQSPGEHLLLPGARRIAAGPPPREPKPRLRNRVPRHLEHRDRRALRPAKRKQSP